MKYALIQLTSALLIALAILGVVLAAFAYKPMAEQYLKQQRWQACAGVYRLEYNDQKNNTVVVSPNTTEVANCVKALEQ